MKSSGYLLKLFVRWATLTLSISLALFLVAGTMQLPSLRNYLVAFSAFLLAIMLGIDPGLARERSRRSERIGTPGRFAAGVSFLATLAVAALEVGRFHSLRPVPVAMRGSGLILFAAAMALEMWAMVANPFFSPDIRLQSERGRPLFDPDSFCGFPRSPRKDWLLR